MDENFKLEDIFIIAKRRILYFIIPVLVCAPIGILTVMLLPAKYTAQGTILVESQQIPESLIASTVNSYAQERIQAIRKRVTTRERLLIVADKYKLFDGREQMSESERVQEIRRNLRVSLLSASGGKRGRNNEGTIAFDVSYTDPSASNAFQVANEFMTLFLTEDVKTRSAGASNTTEFLRQETSRLRTAVEGVEERISAFKQQNADALPEHLSLHIQQLDRAKSDLATLEASIIVLEEERRAAEMQLASYLAGSTTGGGLTDDITRLRAELTALRTDKTEEHPDVRALRERVRALEAQLKPSTTVTRLQQEADRAAEALRAARSADAPDDEQIAALASEAAEARSALSEQLSREAALKGADFLATSLQARIDSVNKRLEGINTQSDDIRSSIRDLESRVARTPAVERGLATLTRDYQNLQNEYQDLLRKQGTAVIAENLEENQRAEKFSILEPAVQPDAPSSPDRAKLSLLAIFAAFGVGAFCAAAAEILMASLRGREHLTSLMGEPPIATVPYIPVEGERKFNPSWPSLPGRRGFSPAPAE